MKKRVVMWVAVLFFALLFLGNLLRNEFAVRQMPMTGKEDITAVLQKETLTENDYRYLLCQTGLGASAIEDIRKDTFSFRDAILAFQEQYFEPIEHRSEFIFFPTTKEETIQGEEIVLPPLRDGDILITRATHTLGFRHGHAAIVIDAAKGKTVESVLLGEKSSVQRVAKWKKYPSLLILRPKREELAIKAAKFAEEHLVGVDYSLFVGLLQKDKQHQNVIQSTHCSHLVWQAYWAAGLDLDGNGWLVLPQNIAASDELEVAFAYGFDAERRWE